MGFYYIIQSQYPLRSTAILLMHQCPTKPQCPLQHHDTIQILSPLPKPPKLEALEPKSSEPEEVKARLDDLNGNGIYAKQ